jgi:hypothetical protein
MSTLTCGPCLRPMAIGDLTAIQQAQLAAAGKLYDGRDLPTAARISLEGSDEKGFDQSFRGLIEFCVLFDGAGAPVYDAVLYMVDSGTVFRAGATNVVAHIIQCGIDCTDPELETALGAALAGKL